MENSKLALIPSGYKSGKVYSILPVDGSGDFNFYRATESSRVAENGLIESIYGIPTIDWLNSSCPNLLLEPQSTNLQLHSEDFNQGNWSKANSSVVSNDTVSPKGVESADKLIPNTTNTFHHAQSITSGTVGYSSMTYSIFVKKAGYSQVELLLAESVAPFTTRGQVLFDLDTLQTLTQPIGDFQYQDYGNGWYRLSITGVLFSYSAAIIRVAVFDNGSQTFSGNGIDGLYIWGAQYENKKFATSFIPTSTQSQTRTLDICNGGGDADLFNISEGSLFFDAYTPNSASTTVLSLSDGTDNQKIQLNFESSNSRVMTYSSGGVLYYNTLSFNQRSKILITFKLNEYKTYINGFLVNTDTSASVPTGMDRFNFSTPNASSLHFEGNIYDSRVYDRVLTESESIQLTTI